MVKDYFTSGPFGAGQAFESLQELYALNAATAAKLFEQQKAIADVVVETGTKQLELFRNAGSYQSVIAQQKGIADEYRDKLTRIARDTVSIVFDGTDNYAQWARQRVAEFEAVQPVAQPVPASESKKAA